MRSRNQPLGIALVVLSALCLIQNAGVSRVVLRAGLSPALLTTTRVTFTFLVLLVLALLLRRTALVPPRGRLLLLLVLHGAVGVAALQWTYFVAIDRLPVSMALLLEYQAPVLVALWARLVQKEAVRPRLWLGLALAVLGLAAATEVWNGARFDIVGILAGLGAALTFSAYFLIGEAGVAGLDPMRVILWSFGVATICMNLFAPLTGFDGGLLGERTSMLGAFAQRARAGVGTARVDRPGRHAGAVRAVPARAGADVGDHGDHGRDAGADRRLGARLGVVRRDARGGGRARLCRGRGRHRGRPVGPGGAPRGGATGHHLM